LGCVGHDRESWSNCGVSMVKLTATNLPSPAPPYLLEVKDIQGGISWDRLNDIQPVLVQIIVEGLPRREIRELAEAFDKLGSYRKVLVRLVPLESSDGALIFSGFIKNINAGTGARAVTLEMEEAE